MLILIVVFISASCFRPAPASSRGCFAPPIHLTLPPFCSACGRTKAEPSVWDNT